MFFMLSECISRMYYFYKNEKNVKYTLVVSLKKIPTPHFQLEKMKRKLREFPGDPVLRTLCFHCRGTIPGWGTKILQDLRWGQREKNGGRKKKKIKADFRL